VHLSEKKLYYWLVTSRISVVKIVKSIKHVLGGGWDERQQRERIKGSQIFSTCVSSRWSQCNYAAAAAERDLICTTKGLGFCIEI